MKKHIIADIQSQKLFLFKGKELLTEYLVSTSKFGIGSTEGSFKTPIGKHKICFKKGNNSKSGMIFINGNPTGEIAEIGKKCSEDYITSRIIGLEGCEKGVNDNSRVRGILIHGTQDEESIGKPASHGCIRMKNSDIIELFDLVYIDMIVEIRKTSNP